MSTIHKFEVWKKKKLFFPEVPKSNLPLAYPAITKALLSLTFSPSGRGRVLMDPFPIIINSQNIPIHRVYHIEDGFRTIQIRGIDVTRFIKTSVAGEVNTIEVRYMPTYEESVFTESCAELSLSIEIQPAEPSVSSDVSRRTEKPSATEAGIAPSTGGSARFCNYCGRSITKDRAFCPYCSMKYDDAQKYRICNHCYNKVTSAAVFCDLCGNPLNAESSDPIIEALSRAEILSDLARTVDVAVSVEQPESRQPGIRVVPGQEETSAIKKPEERLVEYGHIINEQKAMIESLKEYIKQNEHLVNEQKAMIESLKEYITNRLKLNRMDHYQ